MSGWIGVDFDGTLAHYDGSRRFDGFEVLGDPIGLMVNRVIDWLQEGKEIRIVTARADGGRQEALVKSWCLQYLGRELRITRCKDFEMLELWDDRAVQVETNTGRRMDGRQ